MKGPRTFAEGATKEQRNCTKCGGPFTCYRDDNTWCKDCQYRALREGEGRLYFPPLTPGHEEQRRAYYAQRTAEDPERYG